MRYLCLTVHGDTMLEASLKEHASLGWTLHTLTHLGRVVDYGVHHNNWHVVLERGI